MHIDEKIIKNIPKFIGALSVFEFLCELHKKNSRRLFFYKLNNTIDLVHLYKHYNIILLSAKLDLKIKSVVDLLHNLMISEEFLGKMNAKSAVYSKYLSIINFVSTIKYPVGYARSLIPFSKLNCIDGFLESSPFSLFFISEEMRSHKNTSEQLILKMV